MASWTTPTTFGVGQTLPYAKYATDVIDNLTHLKDRSDYYAVNGGTVSLAVGDVVVLTGPGTVAPTTSAASTAPVLIATQSVGTAVAGYFRALGITPIHVSGTPGVGDTLETSVDATVAKAGTAAPFAMVYAPPSAGTCIGLVFAIDRFGSGGGGAAPTLGTALPQALGTAAVAGTAMPYASEAHIHPNTGVLPYTLFDAKGDLLAGTAADLGTRLAVGSNDQALIADSAQATGLKWAGVILQTLADAKGDLIAASAADTWARVAVGSNDQALVADSAQAAGVKWAGIVLQALADAKGDLVVATAADTWARLAVGTDGHALLADSSQASGLRWGTVSGGGGGAGNLIYLGGTVLSGTASTISFANIPQTYRNLHIFYSGTATANGFLYLRFNGDTGTNYTWIQAAFATTYTGTPGGTVDGIRAGRVQAASGVQTAGGMMTIPNYHGTVLPKILNAATYENTVASPFMYHFGGGWGSAVAIGTIDVTHSGGGNFGNGFAITLYATDDV